MSRRSCVRGRAAYFGGMRSVLLVLFALALSGCQALTVDFPAWLFGPPEVQAGEAHSPDGARFDHADLDAVLKAAVDDRGEVHYEKVDAAALDRYVESLAVAPYALMSRDEKLALLINAYNAFTLRLILDHRPLDSINDIPSAKRWEAERWTIGGQRLSLDALENKRLRVEFREPRIHFAVNCASVGCPPLRAEAYDGARIEAQLAEQTARVHADARWIRFDDGTLELTRL